MTDAAAKLDFPRRRWWVRRVDDRSVWIYLFGGRVTLFKYVRIEGGTGFLALYVNTRRLNVNWRPYGSL